MCGKQVTCRVLRQHVVVTGALPPDYIWTKKKAKCVDRVTALKGGDVVTRGNEVKAEVKHLSKRLT